MSSGDSGSSRKNRRKAPRLCRTARPWFGEIALVHVVQQLDLFAELLARLLEQLERAAHGSAGLEHRAVVQRLARWRRAAPPRAVARHAGHAHLHAHMAETLRHEALRALSMHCAISAPEACL